MKRLAVLLLIAFAVAAVSASGNSIIVEDADIAEQIGYADSTGLDVFIMPRVIVDRAGAIEQIAYTYSPNLAITLSPRIVTQQAGANNTTVLLRPNMIEEIPDPRYRVYLPTVIKSGGGAYDVP